MCERERVFVCMLVCEISQCFILSCSQQGDFRQMCVCVCVCVCVCLRERERESVQHFSVGFSDILCLLCSTGGAAFGLFGKKTNKFGRDPIVVFGYVLQMAAFYIAFINLPMDSPIRESSGSTYFTTRS